MFELRRPGVDSPGVRPESLTNRVLPVLLGLLVFRWAAPIEVEELVPLWDLSDRRSLPRLTACGRVRRHHGQAAAARAAFQRNPHGKERAPESFVVFKPVGQIVMAFRAAGELQSALGSLHNVSPPASFGRELNLIKSYRTLAEDGCLFLVVHAPEDEQISRVTAVANPMHAVTAQRYGRRIIEELVEQRPGSASAAALDR